MKMIPNRPHRRVLRRNIRVDRRPVPAWRTHTGIDVSLVWPLIEEQLGVSRQEMLGKSRTARVSDARRIAIYLLRESGWTFQRIGDLFGSRDHTTMLFHVSKAELMMDSNRHYAAFIEHMMGLLGLSKTQEAKQ